MMSNASFHFSDTDSEDELMMITGKIDRLNFAMQADNLCSPLISVTVADSNDLEPKVELKDNLDYLLADGEARSQSRRSSIAEALTDVDEIYSDPENEEKGKDETTKGNLNVTDNGYQGETDLEDLEADENVQETIYIAPRSDILTNLCGEMIITKEGDEPFSEEVRNRLSSEQISINREDNENVPDMPDTDSDDVDLSEDETKLNETAYCHIYNDLELLANSQIVMTNKMENTLHVPDMSEEAISDCHTDVEDVD